MTTAEKELHDELILFITKSLGNRIPKGYIRSVNAIHDKNEIRVLKVVNKIIKRARVRFLKKFKSTILKSLDIRKANNESDIKSQLRDIMDSAFAGASDELVSILQDHIDDIARNFSKVYDAKIDYNLINKKAIDYLRETEDNYFTTLSHDAAAGIKNTIAEAMASKDGYDLQTIVSNIRSTWGKDTIELTTQTLNVDDWAMLVARSETARAASYSTQATLESLNLTKWQWFCNDSPCDDCDSNNEQIVDVGNSFTSGDDSPPAHPNCRCITIALQEELSGAMSTED